VIRTGRAACVAAAMIPLGAAAAGAVRPSAGRVELVAGERLNEPFAIDAGTGVQGMGGLGRPPDLCPLNRPHGAVVHPRTGELYIADSKNHRVLRVAAR
jgi:hypothetical protein